MWQIDKQFSFCYGHRVWSQQLIEDYCAAGDAQCKCRHLHGHEGLVHVFLEGNELERGMVTDFKHLGWMKNFIDTWLDHKFIVDVNDPMFEQLVLTPWRTLGGPAVENAQEFFEKYCVGVIVPGTDEVVAYGIDTCALLDECEDSDAATNSPEFEVLDGFTIVDFVPTSENFSKWLWTVANNKMSKIGVNVSRVDWFETPKSRSSYVAD
jgi:6-pyruvoyltetrahydropterin/6-carboxytetrahydropterin synthase